MSTQVYIKCPVHDDKLPQENFYGMDVYFCEKCQKYYAQSHHLSNESRATFNGHPISFEEKIDPITASEPAKNETLPSQNTTDSHSPSDVFQIKFNSYPSSSEKLMCPIHKDYLGTRFITLPILKNKSATVGFCAKCDTLYSNDFTFASRKKTELAGKRIIWSPLELIHHSSKKHKSRYKEYQRSIRLKTNSISIISKRSKIPTPSELIASAIATVSILNFNIRVNGYFDPIESIFYTTPLQFYMALLPEDIPSLYISDPNNLLKQYLKTNAKKNKNQLLNYQSQLRHNRHQFAEQYKKQYKLLPIATYSQPILYEQSKHCPFCSSLLLDNYGIRMAIYQETQVIRWCGHNVLYCSNCKVSFINQEIQHSINKMIVPNIIHVIDSRLCSSPADLMRIALSPTPIQSKSIVKRPVLPHEKDLAPNLPLPNLSQVTASNYVLVFANTCHCSKCKEKYQQNTIKDRTALVKTQNGQIAKITVQFCIGCGRYFMNITTFRECCKKYGGLLLECKIDAELASQNSSWINFAPDTVLSRCGYSVKKGIPKSQRQTILSYILDSKKATKYEVQEILSRFIRMRKHYQPEACARWQEDILFVNQYQIQKQEVVSGLSFKKSGHYREKN